MKAKLITRKNPQDREAAPKYYAIPVYSGKVDVDFIARQISRLSFRIPNDIKKRIKRFLRRTPYIYTNELLGQIE